MKLLSLVCVCVLSFQVFAADKEKKREPTAATKKAKSVTCSNAQGDGGFTVTIYNYKRATVLENNIVGAMHVANLSACKQVPVKNIPGSADMIHTFFECSAEAGLDNNKDKKYSLSVSRGGFAGLVEADLLIDGSIVAEDMICR